MQLTARSRKIRVSADGTGIVSQAGGLLLTRTLRVRGLDRSLGEALERWRAPRAVHSPGKILTDLAVALALGGDCPAYVAMLRRAGPVRAGRFRSGGLPAGGAPGRRRAAGAEGHPRSAGRCPGAGLGPGPAGCTRR